ncbi:hypothetical protein [Novosphingobium sp.]|uniref:hypothetical protein n=1 Tax=Novosphingobium sp. TaxID=1874826 RepID=UPI0028AE497B|nr:hypothetical protein [Novosphingobium sp.]
MIDRVCQRFSTGVFLSYGLGSAASILLAAILPLPRGGAVMAGTMPGHAQMMPVILWCSATERLLRMALILAGVMLAAPLLEGLTG